MTKTFKSIFDAIEYEGKVKENVQNYFTNFSSTKISYPIRVQEATSDLEQYPEFGILQKAKGNCKAFNKDDPDKYIIVIGDLSGIQETVYTISSKGALKSLRARSFMLELLCEHICYELITNFLGENYSDTNCNVIYNGGGNFSILLPNIIKAANTIEEIKQMINNWAFEEFSGKFYIAIAYETFNEKELDFFLKQNSSFKKKWLELLDKVEEDKKRKFYWKLEKIFGNEYPKEPSLRTNTQECQICHRDDIVLDNESLRTLLSNKKIKDVNELISYSESADNNIVHELCYQLFILGDRLTEIQFIKRSKNKPLKDGFIAFPTHKEGKVYYTAEKVKPLKIKENDECLWKVNGDYSRELTFSYANYVRKVKDLPDHDKRTENIDGGDDGNNTASFEYLSTASCGSDLIGCLKMDVDNLGVIFSEGLQENNLIAYAHLSRMLNTFFKIYINQICAGKLGTGEEPFQLIKEKYGGRKSRNVSIIYSGGDDLFIIGAWDELVELAYDIQKCFYKFSGLGISGGLTLHQPKFPIYQMAKASSDAVSKSKKFKLFSEYLPRKNRFALFYNPVHYFKSKELNEKVRIDPNSNPDKLIYALKWDDNSVRIIMENLVNLCKYEKDNNRLKLEYLSRGFLIKLFTLAKVWWENGILYVPQFRYILEKVKRNVKDADKQRVNLHIDNLSKELIKQPYTSDKQTSIRLVKIPLTWIDLLQRNKGGQNECN